MFSVMVHCLPVTLKQPVCECSYLLGWFPIFPPVLYLCQQSHQARQIWRILLEPEIHKTLYFFIECVTVIP